MDVVYPLGPQTKWGHNEIRYSLRSLHKHAKDGFDRVHIIGEKPSFFDYSKVVHHAFKPEARLAKELRIWEKIVYACNQKEISEDFFFMNDDYFFLEDFELKTYPYYHKGDLKDFSWASLPINEIKSGYDRKSKRTLDVLQKLGCTTWMFDIHRPNRVNKSRFLKAYSDLKKYIRLDEHHGNGSLLINTTYCNYSKYEGVYAEDLKINTPEFEDPKGQVFSIGDRAYGNRLFEFLKATYPQKSLEEVMAAKSSKLRVVVNDRFTDTKTGQLYTPGVFRFEQKDVIRLQKEGRKITILDGKLVQDSITIESSREKPSGIIPDKPKAALRVLPSTFPSRKLLVANGYDTIESLKEPGIEKELEKIKGLSKAKIIQVGLALEEFN